MQQALAREATCYCLVGSDMLEAEKDRGEKEKELMTGGAKKSTTTITYNHACIR